MTIESWRGPGGTASHPKDGLFTDAANWSGGVVPDGSSNAVLGVGKYDVVLSNAVVNMGGLQIGSGVTLTIDQQTSASSTLNLGGDSVNDGLLLIAGSLLGVNAGTTLINYGEIAGAPGDNNPTVRGDGLLVNDGVIAGDVGGGGARVVLSVETDNQTDGVVESRNGGVYFDRGLSNEGLVSAADGGFIIFLTGGDPSNLSNGALSGGHWSVSASSIIELNGSITQLDGGAVLTLSGLQSYLYAGNYVPIESTLQFINTGSELHVLDDRDYATANDLDVDGLLDIGGGALSAGGITVYGDPGAQLAGFGEIDADIGMFGLLRAAKNKAGEALDLQGDNHVYGTIAGYGTLEIGSGSTELETGSKVFVRDIMVDGENSRLIMQQDLVYDGKLEVSADGQVVLQGHTLRMTGKLTVDSGSVEPGHLQLEGATVLVTGTSSIWSDLRNDGSVTVKNGHLADVGLVNGTGEFHLLAGSSLALSNPVSAGQTVYMDGAATAVSFGTSTGFRGKVSGFAAGDTLTFETVEASGAALSWKADGSGGGVLTVVNGSEKASAYLVGTYQKSMFHLSQDDTPNVGVTYGSSAGADPHTHEGAAWDAHVGWAI